MAKSLWNVLGSLTLLFGRADADATRRVAVSFIEGEEEPVLMSPLGPNRYRLEETPAVMVWGWNPGILVFLGDVIEVAPLRGRRVRFVSVSERAPERHECWIVPPFFFASELQKTFWEIIAAEGGACEGISNSLFVHMPQGNSFDVRAALDRCVAEAALVTSKAGSDLGRFRHAVQVNLEE